MGAGRDSRYSGARMGIGESGDNGGLLGSVGVVGGHYGGIRGVLGGWQGL